MRSRAGTAISVQAAVSRPPDELRAVLDTVLTELQNRPEGLSLSVDLARDLQAPVEAALSVPVTLNVTREPQDEFSVLIAPAAHRHFYPDFRGTLRVTRARGNSSVVSLRGKYSVPLGALGQTVDTTFLRGAARSSLQRFLDAVIEESARRVPA